MEAQEGGRRPGGSKVEAGLVLFRVPMREYLLCHDAEVAKPAGEENALGGPKVRGGVEAAPHGLPRKLPAIGKCTREALFKMRL